MSHQARPKLSSTDPPELYPVGMETPMPPKTQSLPWPGWLEIAVEPRAYGAVIYQLLGLPIGIIGFTWWSTGLSLSLGLAVLGVGLLLGFGLLISVRAMAIAQGRMAWGLTGMPSIDLPVLPEGSGFWDRFKNLLAERTTWLSQLYVLLRLPMGILGFTLIICLIVLSASCILAAGLQWASLNVGPEGLAHLQAFGTALSFDPGEVELPSFLLNMHSFGRVTAVATGLLGLLGTLHLALALTWLDGHLATALLSRK